MESKSLERSITSKMSHVTTFEKPSLKRPPSMEKTRLHMTHIVILYPYWSKPSKNRNI
jgi:hypothetical protein